MIVRFNEIKDVLNASTERINLQLSLYKNVSQDVLEIASFEQYIHHISYMIDKLQDHLDNILDTITHAKLNIISHHLLNQKELIYVDNQLQSQNVYVHSEHSIHELLNIKAYYNQSTVIFSIEIPIFHKTLFKQYHLQPITINHTYSIYIPHNTLTLNDQYYQYIIKPCEKIEDQYYCQEDNLQQSKDNCIVQIILNQPAKCNLIQSTIPDNIIQIFTQYLLINTATPIEFSTTCGYQNRRYIQGIKLIQIENCSMTLNNTVYTNIAERFYEDIIHLQPFHELEPHTIEVPINLPQLNNWTVTNTAKLQELHQSVAFTHHHTITWAISIILFLCISGYLIFIKRCSNCNKHQWLRTTPPTITSNNSSLNSEVTVTPDPVVQPVQQPFGGEELRPSPAYTCHIKTLN